MTPGPVSGTRAASTSGRSGSRFTIRRRRLTDLLFSSAVAFDTAPGGPASRAPSKPGSTFTLYDNEKDARAGKAP